MLALKYGSTCMSLTSFCLFPGSWCESGQLCIRVPRETVTIWWEALQGGASRSHWGEPIGGDLSYGWSHESMVCTGACKTKSDEPHQGRRFSTVVLGGGGFLFWLWHFSQREAHWTRLVLLPLLFAVCCDFFCQEPYTKICNVRNRAWRRHLLHNVHGSVQCLHTYLSRCTQVSVNH